MSSPSPDPLEQFVHRALREVPPRRAPAALESRVRAAIAARAARPWWHSPVWQWPMPYRVAVLAAAVLAAVATMAGALIASRGLGQMDLGAWLRSALPGLEVLASAAGVLASALERVLREVAQPYLLGLLLVLGAAYAAFVTLGAGLYRHFVLGR
jgi:hypothetical protein